MEDSQLQRVPEWAGTPFFNARTYLFEARHLHVLTILGIVALASEDPFGKYRRELEKLEASGGGLTEEQAWQLATFRRVTEYATEEVQREFPRLFAHAAVSLWGLLETLVEDVILAWLVNEPSALTCPKLAEMRLPLGVALTSDRQQRAEHIYAELVATIKAEGKGAGQFQPRLDVFGLAPVIGPEIKRTLVELQQVRHIIVHRRSVADEAFLDACPWFRASGTKIGDRVQVSSEDYKRYWVAVHDYSIPLANKVREHFHLPPLPAHADPAEVASYGDFLAPRTVPRD